MSQDHQHDTALAAWIDRIRELRLAGCTLDEARIIAGPMPGHHPDPASQPGEICECGLGQLPGLTLDELASKIAYGILLRAFAEFGVTSTACAAAFAAVALSDAFEEESHAPVHGRR